MQRKADAWKEYGQAALIQQLFESLPAVADAVAQPLAKTDRIVVISAGWGQCGRRRDEQGDARRGEHRCPTAGAGRVPDRHRLAGHLEAAARRGYIRWGWRSTTRPPEQTHRPPHLSRWSRRTHS